MSIADVRESVNDIPGASSMTMTYRYIDGVSHEMFKIGDVEALVQSPATADKIRAAFAAAGLSAP
jgi:hypothetical protein